MSCYRPVTAWKPVDGPISFHEKKDSREIKIKCGQCIGCRISKREEWAIRCFAESKMHARNAFVTLTYDQGNLPYDGSLNYVHFQLFMKRLRKKCGPVRFFMCGEYGEQYDRPHYHALLFGLDFPDRVQCNSVYSNLPLYRSDLLDRLWGKGMCTIGEVTYESARYCAVYTTKKITGQRADEHYQRVIPETGEVVQLVPEFARMSLGGRKDGRGGIGYAWLKKYWPDLYESGSNAVIVNGQKKRIPRYFDKKMDEIRPLLMDAVEYQRFLEVNHTDNTSERLKVREQVAQAKEKFNSERKFQ